MGMRSFTGWALALAALAGGAAAHAAPAAAVGVVEAPVVEAIARAVLDRVGSDATITIDGLQTQLRDGVEGPLDAAPEPGARTGAPARFLLFSGRTRVGTAVATVSVVAMHTTARRAMTRGERVGEGDVAMQAGPLDHVLFQRVPGREAVVGATLRRDVAAGDSLTAAIVDVPPLVRSGDAVRVRVAVGTVVVEGKGVANGSGQAGDVIRVTTTGTRTPRRARILAAGEVEIIP